MSENTQIDEDLYSRQLFVLGIDAMKRMANSSVLISGLGGLGVEIAKNIILAGVKAVTLQDTENVTMADLASQFYLNESSIGKNRALESFPKLVGLNEYVSVSTSTAELTTSFIQQFNCIIITNPMKYSEIFEISDFCHKNGIAFILSMTRGVFGFIFNDFGETFNVREPSGEKPTRFLISSISNDKEGIVVIDDKDDHNLSPNDHVIFDQVEGMTEVNGREFPVKVINKKSFSIGDTSEFHPYVSGTSSGYGNQIILPITMHFLELKEALKNPSFNISDFSAFGRDQQVIVAFFSLFKSIEENNTSVENVLKNAAIFNNEYKLVEALDEKLISEFVREDAVIAPTAAVLGGIAGQEVIKSVSGKFTPLQMFFTLAYVEALQPEESYKCTLKNDRYDAYRIVFGDDQQAAMQKLRYFMVGAGALGCELLKNWAMMGVATEGEGKIFVTDMDQIERSNLNRQFLFRNTDIGKPKSQCAADAIKVMNPAIVVEAQQNRVGEESENIYNDDFYNSLSGVCNALDNRETRSYNDTQCVYYNKPLLESGTLGPMAHFQIILPHLTPSFNSYVDPPSHGIPECTLHYFPTNINHCTMWARDIFGGLFTQQPSVVNQYLTDKGYVKKMMKADPGSLITNLQTVKRLLIEERPETFEDCIKWARLEFEDLFNHQLKDLINQYPKDSKDDHGVPFWTGARRFPSILTYNPNNEYHAAFVNAAAFMHAKVHGITPENDAAQRATNVEVPEWKPSNQKMDVEGTDNNPKKKKKPALAKNYKIVIKKLCQEVSKCRETSKPLNVEEFEKDDPTNGHMEFIAAAANLRAINYRIPPTTKLEIKGIAGNIIPAIATTTAMVCGFVALEMYKVHSVTKKDLSEFRDGFVNLSSANFQLLQPNQVPTKTIMANGKQIKFSLWDKWVIEGDLTVKEFIAEFENKYGLKISALTVGMIIAYTEFFKASNDLENKKITSIYKEDAQLTLAEGKLLKVVPSCVDEKGDDIPEIPEVYLKYF
ncbi:Ubiquitin-like modifier-activating enzyme 1 [Tritrichomonas foetus]|uniref:E1 ubiquitin-activating enzyme n=1 Tax=Tritrichomonas foetus TaxID=1144522 RepID=A0A1J4JYR2_9EUKA|nr:Ubiquitin-like modifier-activating enzyme 1 [Tritrichomonas foetus]|eukprot:OHT04303.1 Ubiquitin-like modifier-activating enzyme 1 [Tritrichomonas foetus]